MSSTFRPDSPDRSFDQSQQGWLRRLQNSIKTAWEAPKPHETFQVLHVLPQRLEAGMVVNTDGTDVDLGSGPGLYLRNEANDDWQFLGAAVTEEDTTDYVTEAELDKLTTIANEQLRQLTKIERLLSKVSGVVINDRDIDAPTYQLRQLTKIALILSVMSGTSISDSETDLTNL